MDDRTIQEFEQRLNRLEREAVRLRKGQVTATAPLEARFGAADTSQEVNTVSGTVMTENDPVAALSSATDTLVLGKVVDQPTGVQLTTTTEWLEQQNLTDVGTLSQSAQYLGWSVSISSDGSRAVVGAPDGDILYQANEGYAAVYKRTGTTWALEQALTYSLTAGALYQLGFSVAMNNAGDTIVSANGEPSYGETRIYTRSGTTWSEQADLNRFALSVAISEDGNTVARASGLSWGIHTRSGTTWSEQTSVSTTAYAVALSADGNTLAVGNYLDTSSKGNVRIYTRSGTTWTLQATLTDSGGSSNDQFGTSVALSDDGNTLVAGAPLDDVSSNTNQGSARIFTRSGSTWTQGTLLTYSAGAANDNFGRSVAINGAGDRIIVGQGNDDVGVNADRGSVVLFDYSGSVWDETTVLLSAAGAAGDQLGRSVAISDDGQYIIGGAPYDDVSTYSDHGSASIFALTTTTGAGVTVGDGSVTEVKLANNAVTSAKILDGTIATADLADDAVTSAKLRDDAATDANRAVTTNHIRDDAITSAKIAADAVGSSEIAADAVGSSEIAADAVGSSEIANGAVGTTEIADSAVTSVKIGDGEIVNGDINASAGIALSKLATDPLARSNHTGTQTASTVSDFDTQVRTSRLDQMAAPTASVSLNSQKITNLATPTASTDGATKDYVDNTASSGTPDADATTKGKIQLAGDLTGTAASPQIASGVIVNADVNASAGISLSKLASGSSGQIIVANSSGVPTYVTASSDVSISNTGAVDVNTISNARVSAYRTATQSLTNNTDANVTWGGVDTDPSTFWSAGAATRLTVPTGLGGLYLITAHAHFDSNGTGARYMFILVDGAVTTVPRGVVQPAATGFQTRLNTTQILSLTAAQYVQVQVRQNSGGALNLTSAQISMLRIDA